MPPAVANPLVAPVVELSHEYVYDPLPPVGAVPVNVDGVAPEQIVCVPDNVLLPSTGLTVMASAAEVSLQLPASVNLLYHVLEVNAGGE